MGRIIGAVVVDVEGTLVDSTAGFRFVVNVDRVLTAMLVKFAVEVGCCFWLLKVLAEVLDCVDDCVVLMVVLPKNS